MYRRLAERDPVHRSYLAGGWVLTRHTDAAAVLRGRRFAADERHFYIFERIWHKRAHTLLRGLASLRVGLGA